MSTNKELLTATEVGKIFGVQNAAVRYWIRSGKLKAEPYGSMYLVKRSDVVDLLLEKSYKKTLVSC